MQLQLAVLPYAVANVLGIFSKYTCRKVTFNIFSKEFILEINESFLTVSHLMIGPALRVKDYSSLNRSSKKAQV